MPVVIDPLGLGRARRTDATPHVTVNGTGFSPTPGQNQAFMGGSLATILTESATQITFDFPSPFSLDIFDLRSIHAPVNVVNLDTGERSTDAWVWIEAEDTEAADERLDTAIPGPFEVTSLPEVPTRFEARDMQRLATVIEALTVDVEPGNVLSRDGTKIAEPAGLKGGGAGQVLSVDLAEATNLLWGFKADAFLQFGGRQPFAAPANLPVNGAAVITPAGGSESWALDDGTLDLISLFGFGGAGGLIDRVRVLVAGVAQFDSGAGLGVLIYNAVISVAVLKGQKIELELNVSGGFGAFWQGTGGIRLLVS